MSSKKTKFDIEFSESDMVGILDKETKVDMEFSESDMAGIFDSEKGSDYTNPGPLPHGQFEVNGIRFPIPPTGISIVKTNLNHNFETLRTRESTKIRSGHSRINITVSAIFTGNTTGSVTLSNNLRAPQESLRSINETLMPILYSLKKLPLCFIDNELIRAELPVLPDEPIGAFIRSVNVGTVPGKPYAMAVEFQFVWYNHRAFAPRIKFRKEWNDGPNSGAIDRFTSIYNQITNTTDTLPDTGDEGRASFIKNYGSPATVFNATAVNTFTENIHEARPLLEYLWPYRYKSTNKAIQLSDANTNANSKTESFTEKSLNYLPPFSLKNFDSETVFEFTLIRDPEQIDTPGGQKSLAEIVSNAFIQQKPEPTVAESKNESKSAIVLTKNGYVSPVAGRISVGAGGRFGVPRTVSGRIINHPGVDILQEEGRPIFAIANGKVRYVQTRDRWMSLRPKKDKNGNATRNNLWSAGIWMIITHTDGRESAYMHLDSVSVSVGAKVVAGQQIGVSGRTAVVNPSTRSHLHIELWSGLKGASEPLNVLDALPHGSYEDSTAGLEDRISSIKLPEAARNAAIINAIPGADPFSLTEEQLKKVYADISKANPSLAAEASAVQKAIDSGVVFLQHSITGKVGQVQIFRLSTSDFKQTSIPMSVNIGFGTNLVMIPLDGHRFPTIQYTGGQQTAGTISFRAEGEDGRNFLRTLADLTHAYENSAIYFREFSKRRGIRIENSLFNAVGINTVLIEATSSDTVPGAPNGVDITMRLVDNTVNGQLDPIYLPVLESTYTSLGVDVIRLLIEKKWITFAATRTPVVDGFDSGLSRRAVYEDGSVITLDPNQTGIPAFNKAGSKLVKTERSLNKLRYTGKVLPAGPGFGLVGPSILKLAKIAWSSRDYSGTFAEKDLPDQIVDGDEYLLSMGKTPVFPGKHSKVLLDFLFGSRAEPGFFASDDFQRWASSQGKELVELLGSPKGSGGPRDKDFGALYSRFTSSAKFEYGNQAYPDLLLPPNPITGKSVDMHPDFFLLNESDVHMCNSNTLKIILGENAMSGTSKKVGLRKALNAMNNAHENILRIYGLGDTGGPGLRPANEGRDGLYTETGDNTETANKGVFKTSSPNQGLVGDAAKKVGGQLARALSPPDSTSALMDIPGESVVMQNDIGIRARHAGYDRATMLDKSYDQSFTKEHLLSGFIGGTSEGETLSNLIKIKHEFKTGEYTKIIEKFEKNYESDHYCVRRSFPTFKVFFVEEDGELDTFEEDSSTLGAAANKFRSVKALDDFYGVNSIKELNIVHHKDMAASVCTITLMDLDGVLFNKKFDVSKDGSRAFKDLNGPIDRVGTAIKENKLTDDNNPFFSTVIKEGMKIIVKFGYTNDPAMLETVFVGQVVNFEGNQLVTIVAQSYGSELVAKSFGSDPSENVDTWNTYTADLIHDLLDREEVRHFGRWQLKDIDVFGKYLGHEKLRPDGKTQFVYTWRPSVVDDNVYIPDRTEYSSFWAKLWGDLHYVYFDTTIWDTFKEMELRHPGYIVYPVPYGAGADARMTLFFGHPDMLYLSRPPSDTLERESELGANAQSMLSVRDAVINLGRIGSGGTDAGEQALFAAGLYKLSAADDSPNKDEHLRKLAKMVGESDLNIFLKTQPMAKDAWREIQKMGQAQQEKQEALYEVAMSPFPDIAKIKPRVDRTKVYDSLDSDKFWKASMAANSDRIRPFRNYETVTSLHDIICNNIRTDITDTYNSVELQYTDNENANFGTFLQEEPATLTVNADDNIKEHHIRRTIEAWPNCTTTDLARRYASQLLANSIKKTYKGNILIMGRPKLKPYDIVWIHDNYSDMAGPIEIEEVVHCFNAETGFTTDIVPNMIVTVKEEVKTLMVDAMGAFFTEQIKDFTQGALLGLDLTGAGTLLLGTRVGGTLGVALADKIKTAAGKFGEGGVKTAGVVAALGGATRIATDDTDEGQFVGGFASGIATGIAFAFHPITVSLSAIVAGSLMYKILKYNSTREPIVITPLIKDGKPYVIGLEAMETDGLIVTDLGPSISQARKDWRYFIDGIEDAASIVSAGWANFFDGDL